MKRAFPDMFENIGVRPVEGYSPELLAMLNASIFQQFNNLEDEITVQPEEQQPPCGRKLSKTICNSHNQGTC
jgi:hypothetical protein